jgi:16S rRNA (guanine527-N7)-methyltransferase
MKLIHEFFPGLTSRQKEQFQALLSLYPEWNARINVISRKDIDSLEEKHILHSLSIAKFMHFLPGTQVMDIGCGGGFPVIPLAIFFPGVKFTAVDSIGKKIKVVTEIAREAGLENVTAVHSRAEDIDKKFDFIISRAVAPMHEIIGWCKEKLLREGHNERPNGFIFLKGGDLTSEYKLIRQRNDHEEKDLSEYFPLPFFQTKKLVYLHLA